MELGRQSVRQLDVEPDQIAVLVEEGEGHRVVHVAHAQHAALAHARQNGRESATVDSGRTLSTVAGAGC